MSGDAPPADPPPISLYEEVLNAAGSRLPAARPPRASAAIVLWRRSPGGDGIEVFWLERGRSLPFMGGWRAFPGGGLDPADAARAVDSEPTGCATDQVTANGPDPDPDAAPDLVAGLVACALRELDEETGVRLAAHRLTFAGRWLTPPLGPLRFDNRFFLAEWRAGEDREPRTQPPENESGEWIAPAAALARWQRSELLVAPPVLHILRVLGEDGPERGLRRLRDTREADLGPLRRIELVPGALLLPLAAATLPPATHTNAYLLGQGEAVLVDPGSPFAAENARLLAALDAARRHPLGGRRVVAILLTHHHPDHVAGVETVRRALGVPVAAHPATAERLAARGIAVERELVDGERIELAGTTPTTLRVVHTPGHARGHLGFLLEESGAFVCGDLVAGFGTIVIDPPEGDMDQYLASLARVRELAPRLLLPAHGGAIRDAIGKLDEYVAHRLAREAQVLAAWRDGLRDPAAMIPTVYPEVPPLVHPLAARQIRAHLERLARHGAIALE